MRVLFFGDVVGEIGLRAFSSELPKIKKALHPDFIIVNAENTCKGSGLTHKEYKAFIDAGADCLTLGNHWRGRDQIDDYIDWADHLIRPLNIKSYFHGDGSSTFEVNGIEITVTNVLGQAFMKEEVDDPVTSFEGVLDAASPIHIVDFHADSTSEKRIFAEMFRGKVSAVIGTHTHVQTADETILDGHTGFLTDAGFCGFHGGIIGYDVESVTKVLVDHEPGHFLIPSDGPVELDFVLLDIDETTGACRSIEPIRYVEGKEIVHVAHPL